MAGRPTAPVAAKPYDSGQPRPTLDRTTDKWRVAVAQMTSGALPQKNIDSMVKLIKAAHKKEAKLIAFPEVCNIMEHDSDIAWERLASEEDDPHLPRLAALAADMGIWILLGSYLLRAHIDPDGRKKFYNRSLLISDKGEIICRYDKIHLFDIDLANGESYRESDVVVAGGYITTAESPWGRMGLTICYDLRFPYLYRKLNHLGATIIFVPAAFTDITGRAHWHSLLRARAIENACFIIAPAQVGRHQDGRKTFGHSLVVGPWGDIIAEQKSGTNKLLIANLDLAEVDRVRAQIPAYRSALDYTLS